MIVGRETHFQVSLRSTWLAFLPVTLLWNHTNTHNRIALFKRADEPILKNPKLWWWARPVDRSHKDWRWSVGTGVVLRSCPTKLTGWSLIAKSAWDKEEEDEVEYNFDEFSDCNDGWFRARHWHWPDGLHHDACFKTVGPVRATGFLILLARWSRGFNPTDYRRRFSNPTFQRKIVRGLIH